MAANKLLFLALMCWCVRRTASAVSGEGRITLTPAKLTLTSNEAADGGLVTVKCEAVNVGTGEKIVTMIIERTVKANEIEYLVGDIGDGIDNQPTSPGMSASGGIKSGQQLTLRMEQTHCDDAGNYSCSVSIFKPGEGQKNDKDVKNLEVEVSPGPIDLTPDPRDPTYIIPKILILKCNAPVGNVKEDTQLAWVWEYRNKTDAMLGRPWTTVNENHATIEDVQTDNADECNERRQSWLTRNLTTGDTGREYRCYVRRNDVPYPQFAGTYTIGTVTEASTTTPGSGGSSGGGATDKANVGMIIGIVIAVLVVLIVVIVIVVIVVRKRKSKKDEEVYVPDYTASRPDDEPNTPAFTAEPVDAYSRPNRFRNDREPRGMTNKGMDEGTPTEKRSPRNDHHHDRHHDRNDTGHQPRYANDFHEGRPNRGFSYDPDGRGAGGDQRRHYSSDEDGTDSRVNTSQLSIGHGDPSIGTPI